MLLLRTYTLKIELAMSPKHQKTTEDMNTSKKEKNEQLSSHQ
jgi:hypothetical protein